jgi:hypothetical protein
MSDAVCAFCGATAATSAMDMTGHGMRCNACAARAQLDVYRHGERGMGEHLAHDELVEVARAGGREALLGFAATAASAAMFAASGALALGGLAVAGVGMLARGVYRRTQAKRALGELAGARVVKR